MLSTKDIMEAMIATASHNIEKNSQHVSAYDNECQAGYEMADHYLIEFSTVISRDLSKVDDLAELAFVLRKQILGNTYMMKVCLGYMEEVERHLEAELDEFLTQGDTDSI